MTDGIAPVRRLWAAVEPIHAVVYFTPEPAEAARKLGIPGWWTGYFAGRLAPAGALAAAPATAMCYVFAPARVGRALPAAWGIASPEQVLVTRMAAVRTVLQRSLPPIPAEDLEHLVALLEDAVDGCTFEGRTLAAAWSAVPRPDDLLGRLWLAATVLREHRGDGHMIALAHGGLSGIEAGLTHRATGRVDPTPIRLMRGWTDAECDRARRRLTGSGLLDETALLTPAGAELRRTVEEATDRLAADPVTRLGATRTEEAIRLATPLSRHLIDTGVIPMPNPMGVPRP